MDNTGELLSLNNLQEMRDRDKPALLNAMEHGVLGSSIKVKINGKEVDIIGEAEGEVGDDAMLIDEAYEADPHALLTPLNILSQGEEVKKAVIGGRAGKKVGGNIVMFGVQGYMASMQGIDMGIIPQGVGDDSEAHQVHVYLAKDGKQIQPSEIGADKWKLSPRFEKMLTPVATDPKGTMIFTAKPVSK